MAATDPTRFIQLVALPFAPEPWRIPTADMKTAFDERMVLRTSTFTQEVNKDGLLLETFKDALASHGLGDQDIEEIVHSLFVADEYRKMLNKGGETGVTLLDEDYIQNKLSRRLNDDDIEFWESQSFRDGFRAYCRYALNIIFKKSPEDSLQDWETAVRETPAGAEATQVVWDGFKGNEDDLYSTGANKPTTATDELKALLSKAETGMTPEERQEAAKQVIAPIEGGDREPVTRPTTGVANHVHIPPPYVPPKHIKFLEEQQAERDEAVRELRDQAADIIARSRLFETWFEVELQNAIDFFDYDRLRELHLGLVKHTPDIGVREVDGVPNCEFTDSKRAGVILLLDLMLREPGDPKRIDIATLTTDHSSGQQELPLP